MSTHFFLYSSFIRFEKILANDEITTSLFSLCNSTVMDGLRFMVHYIARQQTDLTSREM